MEEAILSLQADINLIKSLLLGNKKTLTLKEGCKYIGYSKSYMYKLTSSQQIPHMKCGKKIFFDKDELDLWVRRNKIKDLQSQAKYLTAKIQ